MNVHKVSKKERVFIWFDRFLTFIFIFVWIFTSYPQIWLYSPFPQQTRQAKALSSSSPSCGAGTTSGSGTDWTNPSYGCTSDDSRAIASLAAGETSRYLELTTLGFSIPAGATISGITVAVERHARHESRIKDSEIKIIKGGTIGSTDKADTSIYWPTTDTNKSYGSASDLWGETWTYSDINAANFGVAIETTDPTGSASEARVDNVTISIEYSENSAPTVTINSAAQLTNGSGNVAISMEVDDAEDHKSMGIINQKSGGCVASFSDATLVSASSTAEFDDSGGDPSVDNSHYYQVGTTATTQIVTNGGSTNTVIVDWDSKNDAPTADGSYCVQVYINDDYATSTAVTQTVTLDNVNPATSGNLLIGTTTPTRVSLGFGTASSDTNWSRYYIYYKEGTSGVDPDDTEHTPTESDVNLTQTNYGGGATTTITGLTPNTDYVFNIWAFDTYGNRATSTEVTIKTQSYAVRTSEYFIDYASFTGTSYEVTLDQNLLPDYFVMVKGADSCNCTTVSGMRGPDENYAAVIADPWGTGDLDVSSAANKIRLFRGNAVSSWVGVVTVVEAIGATTTSSFDLLSVERIEHNGADTEGTATSTLLWSNVNRVLPFGGIDGGGCDTATASVANHVACHVRLWPSGTRTINWTRNTSQSANLATATSTVYVIEWGSEWNVQRTNVTGSAGGASADISDEYDTAAITEVAREQTWTWGTGHTAGTHQGSNGDGQIVTLGNGEVTFGTATTTAVGAHTGAARDYDVYTVTHDDLVTDYRFVSESSAAAYTTDMNINTATPTTTRMALSFEGNGATGTLYPRSIFSARFYNASYWIRLQRGSAGGTTYTAWVQGIDFSRVGYDAASTTDKRYEAKGTLYSSTIDLDSFSTAVNKNSLRIRWNQTIPTGCSLYLYVQGTNTGPTPDYATSTLWGPYSGSGSVVTADLTYIAALRDKRYFRYNVDMLSCSNRTETPTLSDVYLEFD